MEYYGPGARRKHAAEIAEAKEAREAEEAEEAARLAANPQQYGSAPQEVTAQHLAPRPERQVDPTKDLIWALALAFGAASCGFIDVPAFLYPIPLGLGLASGILCIVALTRPGGGAPWYAWLAISAAIAGIVLGFAARSQYSDAQEKLDEAQKQLQDLGTPTP